MDGGDNPSQERRWHTVRSNTSGFGLGCDSDRLDDTNGVSNVVCGAQDDKHFEPLRGREGKPESSDVHDESRGADEY